MTSGKYFNRADALAEESGVETSTTEDDMEDYLKIVMNELHSKKL